MQTLKSIVIHEDGLTLNGTWIPNLRIERFEVHTRAESPFYLVKETRIEGFTIHTRAEPENEEWVCDFGAGTLPFGRLYCYYLYHHAALVVGSQIPNLFDDDKLQRLLSRYQPGLIDGLVLFLACAGLALGAAVLLLGQPGPGGVVAHLAVAMVVGVSLHRLLIGVIRRWWTDLLAYRAGVILRAVGGAFLRDRLCDSAALSDWARKAEFGERAVETAAFGLVRGASGRAAALVALRARNGVEGALEL